MTNQEYACQVFTVRLGTLLTADGSPVRGLNVHGRGKLVPWLELHYFAADIVHLIEHGRMPDDPATLPLVSPELDEDDKAAAECFRCWQRTDRGLAWRTAVRQDDVFVEGDPVAGRLVPFIRGVTYRLRPSRYFFLADVAHLLEHGRWPWGEPREPDWD